MPFTGASSTAMWKRSTPIASAQNSLHGPCARSGPVSRRGSTWYSQRSALARTFDTLVGGITFGKDGEWSKPRVLEVQCQGITSNNLDQFDNTKTEAILEP